MSEDKDITAVILGSNQEVEVEKNELQEKDEIAILPTDQAQTLDEKNAVPIDPAAAAARAKVVQAYGFRPEEDAIAPRADIDLIMDKILETSDERATAILADAIVEHADDLNFPSNTMSLIRRLLQGYKAVDMEESDWSFELRAEAAMIHYHSPYPEIRSVTEPFDDPNLPCETLRAYVLGLIFMAGGTAINTFFTPRQPAITISADVLTLLLVPCGLAWARWMPKWSFNFWGRKIEINPGPWLPKEQLFCGVFFGTASGAGGTYNVFLVQRLPQYLGEGWVTFGYQILLSLSVQAFGFGYAGVLRRFVVYPAWAIFPSVLPHLALNRALLVRDTKNESIHGWKIPRYRFFWLTCGLMFVYFWLPNKFFQALHAFNWMTWIAPKNAPLATITGFYGGIGFNPWATFDWNVAGTGALITPFFAFLQQYIARVLSALVILGIYYSNWYWTGYIPINSNDVFTNNATVYTLTNILGEDGQVDIEKYKAYGPPYFSAANVFGQGSWIATYSIFFFYVFIRRWNVISKAFKGFYRGLRRGQFLADDYDDSHTRMMRAYPEVPDWWFLLVLALSFALGIISFKAWPTEIPWWSLLALMGIGLIFLIPATILDAMAGITINWVTLFQILAGVWWGGNPDALLIFQAYGGNFDSQAESYVSRLKTAHYGKIPPRAMFRCQMLSTLLNCFIWVGMLNWMIAHFDNGDLCQWNNPEHFVCAGAVSVYTFVAEYGAFGVKNMFTLYPIFKYAILIGAGGSITCVLVQMQSYRIRDWCQRHWAEERFEWWNRKIFTPLSYCQKFDLAVAFLGVHNWTGGNNLSYANNAMYVSAFFMYYVKRRYTAWWEKYNYLLEIGFDVGVALSGLIQTLIFSFAAPNATFKWWGNSVPTAGIDYSMYNQKDARLKVPKGGYFGVPPDQYPMNF